MNQILIMKGAAVITLDGLRCGACNKLLARKNTSGQIAGNFKCIRCGQMIEVDISLTRPRQ
jgi:phage FluMu protein Com